jgi:hypothetical protein
MWFRGAPFSELRRGNVAELLAYAFFYKTVGGGGRSFCFLLYCYVCVCVDVCVC